MDRQPHRGDRKTVIAAAAAWLAIAAGAPTPAGVLVQESFDSGNLAGRGWYDSTQPSLSSVEHAGSGGRSLEYTFLAKATKPTAGSPIRKKFAPTDAVYLSYHVKYGAGWIGSQKPYHPHEFHFLTTADDAWAGLSFTHLTVYVEQNDGVPLIAIQDGRNVDQSNVGKNLSAATERRAVAGCNGSTDGYPDECYRANEGFVNGKKWKAASKLLTPGSWRFVEAFVKLNSIRSGNGVNDGIVQYWLDGRLVIDHHDALLRTGTNASMLFNQIAIAPYIGDGSPIQQTMWIDDLTVATERPGRP